MNGEIAVSWQHPTFGTNIILSNIFARSLLFMLSLALSVKAMLILIDTRKTLEIQGHTHIEGYGDVGRIVSGEFGEKLVNAFLVVSQVGFSTAYLIFICKNAHAVLGIPIAVTAILCTGPLCYLVGFEDLSKLSKFSLFADVSNVLGLTIILVQDFEAGEVEAVSAIDFRYFVYVVSVSAYCFEGVGMILPLESSSNNRNQFPLVLMGTLLVIVLFMIIFAIAGCSGFGTGTLSPITLNLGGNVANLVKLCLSVSSPYPIYFLFYKLDYKH